VISCVINAHNEGSYLLAAIISAKTSQEHLHRHSGVESELIIILDNADNQTSVIAHKETSARVFEVSFSDLGSSRNFAVEKSKGSFVAFLDGDDLWSYNWLSRASDLISQGDTRSIFHPQVSYYFGHGTTSNSTTIFEHKSSDNKEFDKFMMCSVNPWTALCLANKELLQENPYFPLDTERGLGFEDWSFNLITVEKNITHRVVPDTAHFIRNKPKSSMRLNHFHSDKVFYPSTLWESR
jgi:glycosyltransferase involved in cell wall biosynthesis